MHTAGARALREDDNEMSREAVLLQWERKIEAAERLEDDGAEQPAEGDSAEGGSAEAPPGVLLHLAADEPRQAPGQPRQRRFERSTEPPATASTPERRTITITGQPTPARRRRAVVDAQLAQPDRIALWAFLLGLLLVAVAAGTAHA